MSAPGPAQDEAQERRIQRVLVQARREVGLRDVLVFSAVRMWIGTRVLSLVVSTLLGQWWRGRLQRTAAKGNWQKE